jgi:hypothetical protein
MDVLDGQRNNNDVEKSGFGFGSWEIPESYRSEQKIRIVAITQVYQPF